MYRALDTAYRDELDSPKDGRPEFAGYDGNNDDHYGFANFILDDLNLF
jgi:hypothetical protein